MCYFLLLQSYALFLVLANIIAKYFAKYFQFGKLFRLDKLAK